MNTCSAVGKTDPYTSYIIQLNYVSNYFQSEVALCLLALKYYHWGLQEDVKGAKFQIYCY